MHLEVVQDSRGSPLNPLPGPTQPHHPDLTPPKACGTAPEHSRSHLSTTRHHLPQSSTSSPTFPCVHTVTVAIPCAMEAALRTHTSATHVSAHCWSAKCDRVQEQKEAAARPEPIPQKVGVREHRAEEEKGPGRRSALQQGRAISGTCRHQAMPGGNPKKWALTKTSKSR